MKNIVSKEFKKAPLILNYFIFLNEIGSHVAQADLNLTLSIVEDDPGLLTLLVLPPNCQTCKYVPSCPTYVMVGIKRIGLCLAGKHSTN